MRLINVETFKLEEFIGVRVPAYAALSHTWGNDSDEVFFRDVEGGRIENAGIRPKKFMGCCIQAKKDGLQYAWIDTCCIDNTNHVELGEAINSMFKWYGNAEICYAYLSDVTANDHPWEPESEFFSSRWFERGWTLQELLAPKNLCFYNSEWSYLGTKREMSVIIEKITRIPRLFLVGAAELHEASVAQRMSWAAKRATKREEDIAYCLLGIFGVSMSMIYGEGCEAAFSRLQQEIMRRVRDDSILAWGLNLTESTPSHSTEVMSGGVLAAAPSDFVNCGQIVSQEQYTTFTNSSDIFGGSLRMHLPLFTTSAGETFGLLRCYPGHNKEQAVGIPLNKAMPTGPSDEYIRPHGRCSVILSRATSEVATKFIYVQTKRQSKALAIVNRKYWFYVEQSLETNLEWTDAEPHARWRTKESMIETTTKLDGSAMQRTWIRFQHRKGESRDFVVVLDFEIQGSEMKARCHAMISSRDTTLSNLAQNSIYMRQNAFGKQSASNGILNLGVTLREEPVLGQTLFVVRLAAIPSPPEVTVDATAELQLVYLKFQLVSILQKEDKIRLEAKGVSQRAERKMANLEPMKAQLVVVDEKLKRLNDERRLLVDGIEKGFQEMVQLTAESNEIRQWQEETSKQTLQTQRRLNELLSTNFVTDEVPESGYEAIVELLFQSRVDSNLTKHRMPLSWAAENGYEAIVTLLLRAGKVDIDLKDNEGRTPLMHAAGNGHETVVELLLKKGAELKSKNSEHWTLLMHAAAKGHKEVVEQLLRRGARLECKDNEGRTPLMYAAVHGNERIVELLLNNSAELESQDTDGQTPLMHAAISGHERVVELLLKRGAKLESGDVDSMTPLMHAAISGNVRVVELLLKRGAKLEAEDNKHTWTPLTHAAVNGHKTIVELLLKRGAKLESKDNEGRTPLILVAANGNERLVELLLNNNAVLESQDMHGWTPLMHAISNEHKTTIELLLKKGAKLESKDSEGRTPLMYVAENGNEQAVELLLQNGAELESQDSHGVTPLMYATLHECETTIKPLLKKGAKLESKDSEGRTPLTYAAQNGNEQAVELLLHNGAELESQDKSGATPLIYAIVNEHEKTVELLLKKGSKLEFKDNEGCTSLIHVAASGNKCALELLLNNDARLESQDKRGRTPLMHAAISGNETVVELLLKSGAKLESADVDGRTPLMYAAINGQVTVAEMLLENRAKLEATTENGMTPLMYAAKYGHEAMAELLLKAGAELESKDSTGLTPLSWAAQYGHPAVTKLLLKKGAMPISKDNSGRMVLSDVAAARQSTVLQPLKVSAEPRFKDNNRQSPRWLRKIRGDRLS